MQVILRDALENLGSAGEIVSVKPGYARLRAGETRVVANPA